MSFFRILTILFITSLTIAIFWATGFIWFFAQIAKDNSDINQKHHAIIVLTGAKGRIDAGLQLLSDQYSDKLFITGVGENTDFTDLSKNLTFIDQAQVAKLKSAIILGHQASSTKENAKEVWLWLQQYKFQNIILVTSNYHMPRSLYLFKQMMPELSITPYPIITNAPLQLLLMEYCKYSLTLWKSAFNSRWELV